MYTSVFPGVQTSAVGLGQYVMPSGPVRQAPDTPSALSPLPTGASGLQYSPPSYPTLADPRLVSTTHMPAPSIVQPVPYLAGSAADLLMADAANENRMREIKALYNLAGCVNSFH
jgi:hypothetical protein